MEDKTDIALKRIEQIRKEMEIKIDRNFKDLDVLIKMLFKLIYGSKQMSVQSIKESTLNRYFLYDKKIVDSQEYVDYCKSNPTNQTFVHEINIYQDILNDLETDEYKKPRNLSFMETKKQFREIELAQIYVNRTKIMIDRLSKLKGQEEIIEKLKEQVRFMEGELKKLFAEKQAENKKEGQEAITKKEEAEKIINEYFEKNNESFIEKYRYLPIYDITTHLEPYVMQLYFEAKQLYWLGRYNACIIICCVILEAALKDVIRIKEKRQSVKMEFDEVINHCRTKEYINYAEKEWLVMVKDRFRNPYMHANLEDILPFIMVRGVAVGGGNPEVQLITTQTIPTLRDILKPDFDKDQSLKLFKEVHKFLKRMSEQHFEPKKEPEEEKTTKEKRE